MNPERLFWIAVLVAALVALALINANRARGHGAAAWIMEISETRWCCGPEDCEAVAGRTRFTPRGWTVDGWGGALPIGARGLYFRPTPDGGPWACRDLHTNRLRCLIVNRPEG